MGQRYNLNFEFVLCLDMIITFLGKNNKLKEIKDSEALNTQVENEELRFLGKV